MKAIASDIERRVANILAAIVKLIIIRYPAWIEYAMMSSYVTKVFRKEISVAGVIEIVFHLPQLLLCFAPIAMALPTPVVAVETTTILANATGGYLNLREGPGIGFNIVTPIAVGTTGIEIYECVNAQDRTSKHQWCRAVWQGRSGWLSRCCIGPAPNVSVKAANVPPTQQYTAIKPEANSHIPSRETAGATEVPSAMHCVEQQPEPMSITFKNTCGMRIALFYCFNGPTKRDANCNEANDWAAEEIKENGSTWIGRYELEGNKPLNKGGYEFFACALPKVKTNWAGLEAFNGSRSFHCGFEDPLGGDESLLQRYLKKKAEANARANSDNRAIRAKQALNARAEQDQNERQLKEDRDSESAQEAADFIIKLIEPLIPNNQGKKGGFNADNRKMPNSVPTPPAETPSRPQPTRIPQLPCANEFKQDRNGPRIDKPTEGVARPPECKDGRSR